ncbi:MAG: 2Fe-2S iron-sulfur cluster-binding protein [Phenylobacterium sp.]|uniref:2Fe-2S iron-sulfur cluster-binding protein n=1 Tax=Phenylobacterium sp. TaxID=1871053 RepID=UPI002735A814|nr:2Fe-2S iron-sulfur cluster-binding protein [Phenylobacterium sp.]MDP3748102.1 2Fe-2S iron-sulfur cluster-binding protein [Phenylobacterium sp.]
MRAAFVKHDGFQCGYCAPGQICSAMAMLDPDQGPAPGSGRTCNSHRARAGRLALAYGGIHLTVRNPVLMLSLATAALLNNGLVATCDELFTA